VNEFGATSRLPAESRICTSLNVADAGTVLLLELIAKPTNSSAGSPAVMVRVAAFT
jgi:hypothetical protein